MTTIRRDKLKRDIEAGKMLCKSEFQLTDDYRFDLSNKFGETDWSECQVITDNKQFKTGIMNLWDSDFKSQVGSAYLKEDGTISLHVHSNSVYSLKYKNPKDMPKKKVNI